MTPAAGRYAVALFGDSIRIRWEQDTRRALGAEWNVWSTGPINDYDMSVTLGYVPQMGGLDYPYDVVVLGAGVWDQTLFNGHTPETPEAYGALVRQFVDGYLTARPETVLVLVEVVNCDTNAYCVPGTSARYNEKLSEIAAADNAHIRIAPLWHWQTEYQLRQVDGMHFDTESSEVIGELMADAIRGALRGSRAATNSTD